MLFNFSSPYVPSRYFSGYCPDAESGLICVGGILSVRWLIDAYSHGIFPWPIYDSSGRSMVLAWFSPNPRAIFEYEQFHVPRRLERLCCSDRFQIRFDTDFEGVIRGCSSAQNRSHATWITPQIIRAYMQLHKSGYAHSVEAWSEGRLAGGVYGVALGGFFAAESMFYVEPNASKVALVALIMHLKKNGYTLIDIQEITPNTQRFGAVEISRDDYLQRLHEALQVNSEFGIVF
ncbi:MAG: leucyl/phenylalanyl-tRNA--protein transferase [Planctomycetaceae bacterium]|jgi:leucyl/phenylalanyl-tRNA--protein transferase|nr:leucyl/phenylalanyl-tRNA--protein transferase [Planctomycetaceae bacterium]